MGQGQWSHALDFIDWDASKLLVFSPDEAARCDDGPFFVLRVGEDQDRGSNILIVDKGEVEVLFIGGQEFEGHGMPGWEVVLVGLPD